jgi:hypothetical protein
MQNPAAASTGFCGESLNYCISAQLVEGGLAQLQKIFSSWGLVHFSAGKRIFANKRLAKNMDLSLSRNLAFEPLRRESTPPQCQQDRRGQRQPKRTIAWRPRKVNSPGNGE